MLWFCYFQDSVGDILRSEQGWETAEEASLWGSRILKTPAAYCLINPQDQICSAIEMDQEAGFTVEPEFEDE
jgi:hypothetical protein